MIFLVDCSSKPTWGATIKKIDVFRGQVLLPSISIKNCQYIQDLCEHIFYKIMENKPDQIIFEISTIDSAVRDNVILLAYQFNVEIDYYGNISYPYKEKLPEFI